ncbi:hypothetical protein GmHk_05G012648 [Glycine max]|nr:hypothetical protein GmHk_05G012648 [Glycine max]
MVLCMDSLSHSSYRNQGNHSLNVRIILKDGCRNHRERLVIICPKENVVAWFCSLHNKPDNYFKGIVNRLVLICNTFTLFLVLYIHILIVQYTCMFLLTSALKGFDGKHGSKSKANTKCILVKCNKQKGNTECDYDIMHWMSTIVQGSFKDN